MKLSQDSVERTLARSASRFTRIKRAELSTKSHGARDLLLSSLVAVSAISPEAFPEDRQKEVRITLHEITERIRKLRSLIS
jgi:hypothetical protein